MATVMVCDLCWTKDNVSRKSYTTGKKYNGVDNDYVEEAIDLCPECELRILKNSITRMIVNRDLGVVTEARFELNKIFIETFKQTVKKAK